MAQALSFDDLIPQQQQAAGGLSFDDLVPQGNQPASASPRAIAPQMQDNRFMANEPGYNYDSLYPVRYQQMPNGNSNPLSGELALPEMIRSPVRGFQDLMMQAHSNAETGRRFNDADFNPSNDAVNAMMTMLGPAISSDAPGRIANMTPPPSELEGLGGVLQKAQGSTRFAGKPNNIEVGLNANHAISHAYDADKASMSSISTNLAQEGSKFNLQLPEIYDKLDSTIGTLSNRVAQGTDEGNALQRLMDIREGLRQKYAVQPNNPYFSPAEGEASATGISPNDLLEIRKAINSSLNAKKFLTAGKGQLLDLKNFANNGLKMASEQSPDFGGFLGQFDKQAAKLGLYESDAMKPFWHPDDWVSWKAKVNNPASRGFTDDTINRASTLLDNLNRNKAGGASAFNMVLPPETSTPIFRASMLNAKEGGGLRDLFGIRTWAGKAPETPLSQLGWELKD